MKNYINSINATTKVRIEDIIERAFNEETEAWGKVVPKVSRKEQKEIEEEEKAVFLWLMKPVHEKRITELTIYYSYFSNNPGAMYMENLYNPGERYEYESKYGKGSIALRELIPKMVMTGKAEVLRSTGSFKTIKFSFV